MAQQENFSEEAAFALQQSWEVHRQAFGPILEPAFAENPQARIPLIAALNHISRREIKEGMELLKQIKEFCVYEEDKAAWTFFVGLCFEMSGAQDLMRKWYTDAGQYNHRFYLPYLKLAKLLHKEGALEEALGYYRIATECLLEMEDKEELILGSAFTNMASCLTMLRRYEDAVDAWMAAEKYPLQPGASATAAILYGAMGDKEQASRYLKRLNGERPEMMVQVAEVIRRLTEEK